MLHSTQGCQPGKHNPTDSNRPTDRFSRVHSASGLSSLCSNLHPCQRNIPFPPLDPHSPSQVTRLCATCFMLLYQYLCYNPTPLLSTNCEDNPAGYIYPSTIVSHDTTLSRWRRTKETIVPIFDSCLALVDYPGHHFFHSHGDMPVLDNRQS